MKQGKSMDHPVIEVLVFDGCPHADPAFELVERIAGRLAPGSSVERVDVDGPEEADRIGFLGSPSIRVNGRDIEDRVADRGVYACRLYDGAGVPPEWLVEAVLLRSLAPAGILFLCVANSARSQMAEGIARSLASPGTRIWSAGSRPTRVRPEAITVLKEAGINMSSHHCTEVSTIPASEVDTVITLCAEEECPVFLGDARRLHWGLDDPSGVTGTEDDRLEAFRNTRDILTRRLEALFR